MDYLNFNYANFSAKYKNELDEINSFRNKFRYLSIITISYILTLLLHSAISCIFINEMIDIERVKWSDIVTIYFIFLFHSFLIIYALKPRSIPKIFMKVLNNGIELQTINEQTYRIVNAINNLEKTRKLFKDNENKIRYLDDTSNCKIQNLVNNYFENEYLNDNYNQIYKEIAKEVEEILFEQNLKIQRNLHEVALNKIVTSKPNQRVVDIVPDKKELIDVFYKDSSIHKIINADEIFELCSEMINKANEEKSMNGRFSSKRDYVKEYMKNLEIGKLGELFVMHFEKKRLIENGKKALVEGIKHVSEIYGDYYGYDILSFDENGNEKFIEVKTTTGNIETEFYLSKNEDVKFMNNPNYYIYRVYYFDCEKFEGMIYQVTNTVFNTHFIKTPKEYKVRVL